MSLTTLPEAARASSISSPSCGSPGCGCRSAAGPGRPGVGQVGLGQAGVLAQHAEQAAHLGQPGPGGVADGGEPLGARVGQPGRGQPGGLGLHRDHRDVVGDHVVQLAGDPGPLAAGQVIGQHPLGELAGGAVGPALLACPRAVAATTATGIADASSTASTYVSIPAPARSRRAPVDQPGP